MHKNLYSFFLILTLIISPSLHAGKNKKNIKQPKTKTEVIIANNPINPISDPEEFGFSHLKSWDNLKPKQQQRKNSADKEQLNKALKAKEEGDINLAEQFLREAARQNSDNAMLHLGCLEEENGKLEEAYTWYMLSLCTKFLKGKKLTEIQNEQNNPCHKLFSLKDKNIHEGYKNFLGYLIQYAQNYKNKNDIITTFMQSFYDLTIYNQKLSSFAFELSNWINSKDAFCILGHVFNKEYNNPKWLLIFYAFQKQI